MKERVVLPEAKVVPFLDQTYTVEQVKDDLRAKVGLHIDIPSHSLNIHATFVIHQFHNSIEFNNGSILPLHILQHLESNKIQCCGGMNSDTCNPYPFLQGKSEAEIERFGVFYTEAQKVVDSKQLRPAIRTQYMRTAFQIPFDSTVRVSLDTNLVMIKENPSDGPTCHATGRCVLA